MTIQRQLSLCLLAANMLTIMGTDKSIATVNSTLDRYKADIEYWNFDGMDLSPYGREPKSRYHTFKFVFEHFIRTNGSVVVELGTSRSFVHGGHPGCNSDNTRHWNVNNPKNWDWGAGFFTRMACECLSSVSPIIHTIDCAAPHITRCRLMTADYAHLMKYHVCSSLEFLPKCAPESIDLLYIDTGDMTPIENTAQLQLAEAKIIVARNLIKPQGLILIDDVRNPTPMKFGETSHLGKAKYSIPYFLEHGFEIVMDEYQVILRRK